MSLHNSVTERSGVEKYSLHREFHALAFDNSLLKSQMSDLEMKLTARGSSLMGESTKYTEIMTLRQELERVHRQCYSNQRKLEDLETGLLSTRKERARICEILEVISSTPDSGRSSLLDFSGFLAARNEFLSPILSPDSSSGSISPVGYLCMRSMASVSIYSVRSVNIVPCALFHSHILNLKP